MPAAITDGEAGSSVRSKINTAFTELATAQSDITGKADASHSHAISDVTGLQTALDGKQATLVSATNIKTINGTTLLGSGDLTIAGSSGGVSDGDKGDITVSDSGATWTIDNGLDAAKIADGTVSNTEFQYLNGVTSALQTQMDAKLDADLASEITTTKGTPVGTDKLIGLDSADSDNPVLIAISTLPAGTPADGSITLAKLADLAQDQFIGRTSASTGVPQTTTITAAARTVLDDTTTAAMLATLGAQPLDSDLTTIASLTATSDNFIQAKSSAWASRTVAQVAADLNGTGLVATNLAYRHIPQNSRSAAYTAVASDAGGHILHPASDNNARTFTIPANGSVAYPIGAAITFVNLINTVTIAINTDTLILAGAGTTGSRTLAANGVATAIKITSTSWIISGTGLT